MLPRGTFQCAICEERHHVKHRKEAYRSHYPERKIPICEYCYNEWRTSPEYEHLRPDIDPSEKKEIEEQREYQKDTHIYF